MVECKEDELMRQAIPESQKLQLKRGSLRPQAKSSEMKEAEDPESRSVLVSVTASFRTWTRTQQVINKECGHRLKVA